MSSRNMLTLMWPSIATGGVSSGYNSGCAKNGECEQVKWLLEMKWMSDCYDYCYCLIIYWPTLPKRARKMKRCERRVCSTNYMVQIKYAGICEWMNGKGSICPHQNKSVVSIFSILVYKFNQNLICLYFLTKQK